jgi:hypothetical protein
LRIDEFMNSDIFLDLLKYFSGFFLIILLVMMYWLIEFGNWKFDISIQLRAAFGPDVPWTVVYKIYLNSVHFFYFLVIIVIQNFLFRDLFYFYRCLNFIPIFEFDIEFLFDNYIALVFWLFQNCLINSFVLFISSSDYQKL